MRLLLFPSPPRYELPLADLFPHSHRSLSPASHACAASHFASHKPPLPFTHVHTLFSLSIVIIRLDPTPLVQPFSLYARTYHSANAISNIFFKSGLRFNFGEVTSQYCLCAGAAVNLSLQVNGKHNTAETAVLSDADADGEDSLCRTLHNHDFPRTDDSDGVVNGSPEVLSRLQGLYCPYPFLSSDDVYGTLGNMFINGFYAWNMRAKRVVGSAENITPHSSPSAHISHVGAGKKRTKTSSKNPSTKTCAAKRSRCLLSIRKSMSV